MPQNRFRLRPLMLVAAHLWERPSWSVVGRPLRRSPPRAAQTPRNQASGCAWPIEDSYQTANSGLPDSAAWEWGQSFTVHQGTQVIVSGVYPDARYASFTVYSSSETSVYFQRRGVVAGCITRSYRIQAAQTPGVRSRHPADTLRLSFACRSRLARSTFCRSPRRALPRAWDTSNIASISLRRQRITHRIASHHRRGRWVHPAAPGLHLAHHGNSPTRSPDPYDGQAAPPSSSPPAAPLRSSSSGLRSDLFSQS